MAVSKELAEELAEFVCACEDLSIIKGKSPPLFLCLPKPYSFITETSKNIFEISKEAWGILEGNFFFSKDMDDIVVPTDGYVPTYLKYRDILIEDHRAIVSYIYTPRMTENDILD